MRPSYARSLSVLVLALATSVAAGGCSILTSLDEFSDGTTGSSDADNTTSDASRMDARSFAAADGGSTSGGEASTSDATTGDGGVNLLTNGNFEDGCSAWRGYESFLTTASGRNGGGGCRACASGSTEYSLEYASSITTPVVGETYRAEAWVRRASAAGGKILVALRSQKRGGGTEVAESSVISVGSEWVQLRAELVVTSSAESMDVYVFVENATANECFIADDVAVTRIE
jgi:hypothetical protein